MPPPNSGSPGSPGLSDSSGVLEFPSTEDFRTKILLSVLSGREIRISSPRKLLEHEVAFTRLVAQLTDNTTAKISPDGRRLAFKPGMVRGGELSFDCPVGVSVGGPGAGQGAAQSGAAGATGASGPAAPGGSRGVGYYLEYLCLLLPFAKFASRITLTGITNDAWSLSPDVIAEVTVKQLSWFGFGPDEMTVQILSRGMPPLGGGKVLFCCRPKPSLSSVDFTKVSLFKQVRGVCLSCNVPPGLANRAISSAKGELLHVLSDVYIQADHARRAKAGLSQGYGLYLTAETVTGSLVGTEVYVSAETPEASDPERLGTLAARWLLEECMALGAPDSRHQPLLLLAMALTKEDVSVCRFGRLTERAMRTLRLIFAFLGVRFSVEPRALQFSEDWAGTAEWEASGKPAVAKTREMQFSVLMCRGAGLRNLSMKGF